MTGHSLGGALSTIGSLDFDHKGIQVDKVITFEQPRTGN